MWRRPALKLKSKYKKRDVCRKQKLRFDFVFLVFFKEILETCRELTSAENAVQHLLQLPGRDSLVLWTQQQGAKRSETQR